MPTEERLDGCGRDPGNAGSQQKPEEARNVFSPRASGGSSVMLMLWFGARLTNFILGVSRARRVYTAWSHQVYGDFLQRPWETNSLFRMDLEKRNLPCMTQVVSKWDDIHPYKKDAEGVWRQTHQGEGNIQRNLRRRHKPRNASGIRSWKSPGRHCSLESWRQHSCRLPANRAVRE